MTRRVSSAQWAGLRRQQFATLSEYIKREQAAEKRERGHDCGHQFTISVTSRGHYGLGAPGKDCEDANWDGPPLTLTVRAHDLQAALLRAATHELRDWKGLEDDDEG